MGWALVGVYVNPAGGARHDVIHVVHLQPGCQGGALYSETVRMRNCANVPARARRRLLASQLAKAALRGGGLPKRELRAARAPRSWVCLSARPTSQNAAGSRTCASAREKHRGENVVMKVRSYRAMHPLA
jgi:hypothetical protein